MDFEELEEANDKLVYIGDSPDKYKYAIVGLSHDSNHIIYSYGKLIRCMVEIDGMTSKEAVEWIDYNTIRALPYYGEYAPIIMFDIEK